MKIFEIDILDNEREIGCAIDIAGYSHMSGVKKVTCSFYPFEKEVRTVYVRAATMRDATKAARRADVNVIGARESGGRDETVWFLRKRRIARERAEKLAWRGAVTPELERLWRIAGLRPF